ncbi:MAG: MraY family glycosyltransferase [Acidobacteriota bacterium]|nr:MAG: undecaprenyl/decaprenyl-phosphate alpha-N-acetylglucosaminyl 1-phosphate transferase [Acidobacteriota bacterium]
MTLPPTVLVPLLAAAGALLATPAVMSLARRFDLFDRPADRKVHDDASIPRLGGLAIVLPTLVASLAAVLVEPTATALRHALPLLATVAVSGLGVFMMGLADDLAGLRPRTKLAVQAAAATAVFLAGARIDHLELPPFGPLPLGWLSYPLTLLWILGLTNALNLIDGLDGLAAGVGTITAGVLAAFALLRGDVVTALPMLALGGALVGFLVYNFNPARIFMGDSGSQFVGFVLASISLVGYYKATTAAALALPLLALGVPIFDMLLAIARRVLAGRSPLAADREHIHHRLLDRGLPHRAAVLALYAATAVVAGLGLVMTVWRDLRALGVFVGAGVFLVLLFALSGVPPLARKSGAKAPRAGELPRDALP